ncbi:MAG: HD domain-containing protein [Anaerolineae bacterium]
MQYPLLRHIINILHTHRLEAYLVGGAVRDMLLGRERIVDLDFVTPGDGLAAARRVANALGAAFYPLDAERGTGRVVLSSSATQLEPAQKLANRAPTPGTAAAWEPPLLSHGAAQNYLDFASLRGATLLDDLADRDFTANAIALRLAEPFELIDPLGGQQDLARRQLRAASATALTHDPVRVLRAVRQAVELDFTLEAHTEQLVREAAPALPQVSPERRRDELLKLLNTPAPGQAVQKLRDVGVIPYSVPEIEPMMGVAQGPPHYLDVFDHTVAALEQWAELLHSNWSDLSETLRSPIAAYLAEPLAGHLSRQQLLPLALLLHDTGKPEMREETERAGARPAPTEDTKIRFWGHEKISAKIARRLMNRFRFSSQAGDFVAAVVAQHMRPLLLANEGSTSRRAVYRFFRDSGEAGVAAALHALADHRATYPPGQSQAEWLRLREVVVKLITAYFEQREQVVDPPPLLSGHDLMQIFDLPEGRLIGVLLNRLREAQATGEVTDKAAALAFIQNDPDVMKRSD